MLALVLLGVAVVCALISRVLLVTAAIRISIWWTLRVLLPFGPMFFRLSYPEEARRSMLFRYATLICFAAYLATGTSPKLAYYKRRMPHPQPPRQTEPAGYALEKVSAKTATTAPTPKPTPSLDERRAANAKQFEQLRKAAEALRIRKRDLLHSDIEGNRQYVVDLAVYNQELANATTERTALSAPGAK